MNAAATVSATTRTTYPELTHHAEFVAQFRAAGKFYARRLANYPATLGEFIDYAFGTAPRAKDKIKGRAVALRELAALASDPVAAAELQATYAGA